MHSHDVIPHLEKHPHLNIEKDSIESSQLQKVVLVGNPNVGKSLFFNYLSGMYVDVSNFPGTTVSISKGMYKDKIVYDTPGIYGVSSFNDEERVARDVILDADIVLNVVNALHLERDLFLTHQLIDMGKKVSVLLNFADEVKKRKVRIDIEKLKEKLGVEVIETAAISKIGFDKIDFAIENARIGNQPEELHHLLHENLKRFGSQGEALLALEGDEVMAKKHGIEENFADQREFLYIDRRNRVNQLINEVEYEDSSKGKFFNLLGRLTLNPATGLPFLAVILFILYLFIGDFVAQRVVDFTENTLGVQYFEYYLKKTVAMFSSTNITVDIIDNNDAIKESREYIFENGLNEEQSLADDFSYFSRLPDAQTTFTFLNPIVTIFFGEFGVVSMTITYLIFLLLPLVIAFYFAMAMLEDSGYLPRLATMMDRTLNKIGLNGRAVIPIMLGFGCVTMATITTRLLGSEREKTIATAILQFVIPCSAQLAVIAVLMSNAGVTPLLIYIGVIFIVLILLSTALNKMLPGQSTPLLIDLPIMRFPKLDNVFKKTFFRTYGFLKEASVWFFVGAFLVSFLQVTGLLAAFTNLLAPITTAWLKLPKEAAVAFVMGVVRRDFGAAGLFDLHLTAMQITVAIITITLFVPCIASFMVMINERGIKEGVIIWASTWVFAFIIGGIVAQIII